jgi:hypothetical protein
MSRTSGRASIILTAFMAFMLVCAPHAARAAVGQNSDWSNCRQNEYQGHIKWAQDKTVGLNRVWQNVTPPTMNNSCLNNLMNMFNAVGTITDPFNIIYHLVLSAIQSFVNQLCQQVLSAVGSAINMIKSALCIPIPSMSMSFSLGGGTFGGSQSCQGVSLLGNVAAGAAGTALPGLWNMFNNIQPR